jgi:hypothetical protein
VIETCLNLFGLLLTGLGAFVTARSVIISKDQAKMLSGTHWNGNEALRRALLAQSHNAQIGLYFICVGTSSQIAALLYSQIAALIYPLFDAVDNWGLTPPCRYKKRTPSVHSRGLQLALFEALLSRRLRGCWGDRGKSPEGPTCASHFANPATAIRDGQHILEHCEPLPEIDDPVTLVTLTVAKMVATLDRWIEGVLP